MVDIKRAQIFKHHFIDEVQNVDAHSVENPKVQEHIKGNTRPVLLTEYSKNAAPARSRIRSRGVTGRQKLGRGTGNSKQGAEIDAASNALHQLETKR